MEQVKKLYSVDLSEDEIKGTPKNILKTVYDKNDKVLFGSNYIKGKVEYNYIPAEFMTTNKPLIISTSVSYDGIGNKDLPEDAIIVDRNDLSKMFPDNKFV